MPPGASFYRDKNTDMADLNLTSVLRKTESGVDAIKIRDRALTPKQRMLLIQVDGSKSVAELLKSLSSPDEARQILGELLSTGYVHEPDLPKAVVKAAPIAAKVPGNAPDASVKPAVQRASRLLEGLLGPASEPLCLQLEKCTSLEQLTAKVQDIRQVVVSMRSERKADEFVAAVLGA